MTLVRPIPVERVADTDLAVLNVEEPLGWHSWSPPGDSYVLGFGSGSALTGPGCSPSFKQIVADGCADDSMAGCVIDIRGHVCPGDSGAPLFVDGAWAGVVVGGSGCGLSGPILDVEIVGYPH